MEFYNLNFFYYFLKLMYEVYNGVVEIYVFEEKILLFYFFFWERNLFIKIFLKLCIKG